MQSRHPPESHPEEQSEYRHDRDGIYNGKKSRVWLDDQYVQGHRRGITIRDTRLTFKTGGKSEVFERSLRIYQIDVISLYSGWR
jgi:hypothetical protein